MNNNQQIWQSFNNSIFTDEFPDGSGEVEGLLWQKPNGEWVMLAGDPLTPGRVIQTRIYFNPWSGEELPPQRQAAK